MKINTKILALIAISLFILVIACKPNKESLIEKIVNLENELKSPKEGTDLLALSDKLLSSYLDYVKKFPNDTVAPEFLYRSAGIYSGQNKPEKVIETYNKIINDYPKWEKIPECYFMIAFTYDNLLHNASQANAAYNKFISDFPDHELVKDAEFLIKYLGKPDNQIAIELEEQSELLSSDTAR